MSRWLRLYDDTINDPKIIKLPEALRWHWIAMLCIASKNDGVLPPLDDIAIQLRVTNAKATEIIVALERAGLLDRVETGYVPHNWEGRQFKSDNSTERVKRFRNVSKDKTKRYSAVSETPPDTESETDTDNSEPIGSGAAAPIDHRKRLFDEGLPKLARLTGKGQDSCRAFVGKCLKAAGDDAVIVLGLIDDAERNQVADPSAWIAARLKGTGPPMSSRQIATPHQQRQHDTKEILDGLKAYAAGSSASGGADHRLLSDYHSERS